jgi:hypothetical protein
MKHFTTPIQEACKIGLLFCIFAFLVHCGGDKTPAAQTITLGNSTVSFVNSSCTVDLTLVNVASQIYTLSFLQASFLDAQNRTYSTEIVQSDLVEVLNPIVISAGGVSEGEVTFDLSDGNLTPPIDGTVVVVGIGNPEVTHFVGNFTCQ